MTKKNNKLTLIIITVILAVALIATGTIFAVKYIKDYVGDTTISFECKTVLAGDTVKLPFSITKNHGIWGGQIKIDYDAEAISFVSCSNGDVFDECEINSADGTVNLIINQTEMDNSNKNGIIATLNFKVNDAAKKGNYTIQFDETSNFCDKDAQMVKVILKDGTITIK